MWMARWMFVTFHAKSIGQNWLLGTHYSIIFISSTNHIEVLANKILGRN